jgi:hypothetical protein
MNIFEDQDPVELFFWQFEQGYWQFMQENFETVLKVVGV